MNLQIQPSAPVFRRIRRSGIKGNWHILARSANNGFKPNTHPDFPEWHNSKTHIALCGNKEDDRINSHGYFFDGHLEWSTVEEISDICRKCFPYLKFYPGEKT